MESLLTEFHDTAHLGRVVLRLFIAVVLGGIVGFERLRDGREAGLRTHMLVSLGSALFTLTAVEGGMSMSDLSRIIQGVAAGIGFLGAGNILKLSEQHRVEGLTSAASIWLTAAAGVAVGAGWVWSAVVSVLFAWAILAGLRTLDHRWRASQEPQPPDRPGQAGGGEPR
jgi:putative Mg2+ transporter-C (MgtC) family protein